MLPKKNCSASHSKKSQKNRSDYSLDFASRFGGPSIHGFLSGPHFLGPVKVQAFPSREADHFSFSGPQSFGAGLNQFPSTP